LHSRAIAWQTIDPKGRERGECQEPSLILLVNVESERHDFLDEAHGACLSAGQRLPPEAYK